MSNLLLLLLSLLVCVPALAQDDDEEMINQLVKEKQIQNESFQQIDQGAKAVTGAPAQMLEELKKTGGKLDMGMLSNPKMVELFKNALKQSKFSEQPPETIRKMIMMKVKGKPLEGIFLKYPKLLDITVAVLKDPEAMPALMGVLPKRDALKFVGICALGFMIFGFLIKKIIVKKDATLLKRLAIGLTIQVIVTISSLSFFYYTFQNELGPTLRVIAKNL